MNEKNQLEESIEVQTTSIDLSESDKRILSELEDYIAQLSESDEKPSTECYIRYEGQCGFASGGTTGYIVNYSKNYNYNVVIAVTKRTGNSSSTQNETFYVPKGRRVSLGCTFSQSMPVTEKSFRYIRESKV